MAPSRRATPWAMTESERQQRKRVRRTVAILFVIAAVIYVGFYLVQVME